MYVWIVTTYRKDNEELDEVSQPYISAEYAMKDWFFHHLEWKHVENVKFSGTVLDHWQAESEEYDYVLEAQHVEGSN